MTRTRTKTRTVWVGFTDGKPHVWLDSLQAFPSRRKATLNYEDVRKARRIFTKPKAKEAPRVR